MSISMQRSRYEADVWYDTGNPGPGLGQAQVYGGVKSVIEFQSSPQCFQSSE